MNESEIEQVSIGNFLTDTPEKIKKIEKQNLLSEEKYPRPALFQRNSAEKPKYFAYLVLLMMTLALLFIHFKSSSNRNLLVDYSQYPFFKLSSPSNADMKWDVFVDIKSRQTFFVKSYSSANVKGNHGSTASMARRLLDDQDQTSITHVLVHKFDKSDIKFYQLIESDALNHDYCFEMDYKSSFNLEPRISASQYSHQKKTSFEYFDKLELFSPEAGTTAEIHTDKDGKLMGFQIANGNSDELVYFKASDPFDIEKIKTRLHAVTSCYSYDLESNKTDSSYNSSLMKCPTDKYTETPKNQPVGSQNTSFEVVTNLLLKLEYGTWCGPHYGGFDNECSTICNEDPWKPTEKCIACCPPVDYTDTQCMFHDVCTNRHEVLNWGSPGCRTLNLSYLESIPCECNFDLLNGLQEEKLVSGCQESKNCALSGRLVRAAFVLHPCGCKAKNCFSLPVFEQKGQYSSIKLNQNRTCVKYDTCLPTSICAAVHDSD